MSNGYEAAVAALAVDYWKLLKSFERVVAEIPPERSARVQAQARFSASRLSAHLQTLGLQLATFDDQEITPMLPVVAINADEVSGQDNIIVGSTIEPAVVSGSRVLLTGRVVAALRGN